MIRLADWFGYTVFDKLTDEQIQYLLVCEHGSINESYVELYQLTGEKRFLDWARRLNDRAMWVPLSEGKDILFGWHANTQIPKFTGFHKYYMFTGDQRFLTASENFWRIVTQNHTWVIGGNSTGEHFFPKEEFENRVVLIGGPETCNSVNMLRLTESLFCQSPDAGKASYYERVLFNHILSAYDPVKGMCCYFTSMRPGHYRIYASRDSSFWCCGHTGLESPAKLGKFIYSYKGKSIRVNLFIPSRLIWKEEEGIELIQRNRIPESEQINFVLNLKRKQRFMLRIRRPEWTGMASFIVNGRIEEPLLDDDGYWVIDRVWEKNNVITLKLPMHIYTEYLPGSKHYIALLYGPYVLAGRLGTEGLPQNFWGKMNNVAMNKMELAKVPCWEIPVEQVSACVRPISGETTLKFTIHQKEFKNIVLEPFYKVHFERYAIYWPIGLSSIY